MNDNSTKSESEKPTINSVTVTATATPVETEEPPTLETATPTPEPTIAPTPIPVTTPEPTVKPTVKPTKKPVVTPQPTAAPTPVPVTPTATPVTPAPVVDTPVTEQPVIQPATPSTDATIQSITDSIVAQVNELRASLGLSALRADSTLTSIAQYRSQHMGDNNYFSHYYNGEKHFKVVADMYGYTGYGIGENIAWMEGYPDSQVADTAMVGWINSPGHYNNMVNTMWTSIGVGAYKIGNKWYLTQIFGTT